ncbi:MULTISPECIES: Pycsar system effector family protein [Streptomyces]|uniref:Pycsar effector protein domain-containing protein n=4 Tax=Streptomyces TaxID=1883 RepID=A0A1D8G8E5_9ACTN|nr:MULTISPECIES: Pycsar system effector family protein [Streptomyces]AOT61712.1 hypothetical protein A4G23_04601 [Streptomyces rubrolavendulae]KAF0650489.1 hypothetical protein K701_07920 [Streptomyces fradiae ATCC 10745 = DSM 40063]OSY52794.1 hypothetical protein BG846_01527 [Streptomyces fradiae ATCC 10745 = DSM 40063]QEV14647.1 hypothetical protein CP974_24705 [Streptomyces fradiae ATCC 10745 = DSM 40063]UQS29465.1 hypothetical protein J5J01_21350 [Streptomyces fradiae]
MSPAPASPEEVRALAERLLSGVREDIGRADTKAAILLSGALAFLAVVFTRDPAPLGARGAAAVLLAVAGVLWGAGMLMLVGVVLPRTRIGADRTLLRDLVSGAPAGALLDRIAEAGADTTSWLLDQASVHGQVLAAKYRWLRAGVLCLVLGAGLALLSELW